MPTILSAVGSPCLQRPRACPTSLPDMNSKNPCPIDSTNIVVSISPVCQSEMISPSLRLANSISKLIREELGSSVGLSKVYMQTRVCSQLMGDYLWLLHYKSLSLSSRALDASHLHL